MLLLRLLDSPPNSEKGVSGELEEELEPLGGSEVVNGGRGDRAKDAIEGNNVVFGEKNIE